MYMWPIVTNEVVWSVGVSLSVSCYWPLRKQVNESTCHVTGGLG